MERFPIRRNSFTLVSKPEPLEGVFPSPVAIEYDIEEFSLEKVPTVALINQGAIAISTDGDTGFYSGGFCGCLGLIISPTRGSGGLVSHISQTGQKVKKSDFLLEAIEGALKLTSTYWEEVNVVLFRGDIADEDNESSVEFPELASVLHLYCPSAKIIKGIQDIRSEREKGDQLLFDTKNHVLYLWKGAMKEGVMDPLCEIMDETQPKSGDENKGKLELKHGKNPMPWKIYG